MLRTVKFPFTVRTHATLATMTKLEWLVHRIFSFTVRTHATLATMTKLEWLVHRIFSFTIRTHATLATMTKLEWLVHRILSFTVRTRDARNDYIHYALCGARSGSPQLFFNYANEINASKNFLSQKSAQKKFRPWRTPGGRTHGSQ